MNWREHFESRAHSFLMLKNVAENAANTSDVGGNSIYTALADAYNIEYLYYLNMIKGLDKESEEEIKDKLTVVKDIDGGWEGLYVNGKSVRQSHKLGWVDVTDYLGIEVEKIDIDMKKDGWGWLPDNLLDLKESKA